MPLPEAIQAIEDFRSRLARLDGQAASDMIRAYAPIWARIQGNIDAILAQAAEQELSIQQVRRLERMRSLLAQVDREMVRYGELAVGRITEAQRAAAGLAQAGTRGIVEAALPRGISTQLLANVGIEWNVLPTQAFESFVGIAGDGKPVANLLAPLGTEAKDGIIQAMSEGIALGKNPRVTARMIRDRFGMPLTRSLTIARTETLRAYRESSRLQYAANRDIVKGWQRHSARDERVCMACLALDGQFYENQVPIDEHPNGRCGLVPITLSYADLGLPVEEPDRSVPSARDWFLGQPEATQRRMMGPGRFDAWKAGEFQLTDMAKVVHNDIWGDAAVTKTVGELVG